MPLVSVIIPSRLKKPEHNSHYFLESALNSIRSQTLAQNVELQVVVGIDSNNSIPPRLHGLADFAESSGRSQAAALNAAARSAKGDIIAILEDDDQWMPTYLQCAMASLSEADFVSSTQLEVASDSGIIRINDFPTPSGWVMTRMTWEAIGGFDETFRWHLDNEWLGRLNQRKTRRIHLVEATAPVSAQPGMPVRPWLDVLQKVAGASLKLVRHESMSPLVRRLVHRNSGMSQIARDPELARQSQDEIMRIAQRFGHLPW